MCHVRVGCCTGAVVVVWASIHFCVTPCWYFQLLVSVSCASKHHAKEMTMHGLYLPCRPWQDTHTNAPTQPVIAARYTPQHDTRRLGGQCFRHTAASKPHRLLWQRATCSKTLCGVAPLLMPTQHNISSRHTPIAPDAAWSLRPVPQGRKTLRPVTAGAWEAAGAKCGGVCSAAWLLRLCIGDLPTGPQPSEPCSFACPCHTHTHKTHTHTQARAREWAQPHNTYTYMTQSHTGWQDGGPQLQEAAESRVLRHQTKSPHHPQYP